MRTHKWKWLRHFQMEHGAFEEKLTINERFINQLAKREKQTLQTDGKLIR